MTTKNATLAHNPGLPDRHHLRGVLEECAHDAMRLHHILDMVIIEAAGQMPAHVAANIGMCGDLCGNLARRIDGVSV